MTTTNTGPDRDWVHEAIRIVEADHNRSADTHLLVFPLPTSWNLDLYLKDESVHPTGSLKHRLAVAVPLRALQRHHRTDTTIIEASSGSTAVSEAYFARLLGLSFVAVMPRTTSQQKIDLIEFHGGSLPLVDDPASIYEEARTLAARANGTTWTSSRTPSASPTGAATTTSRSRSSSRWHRSGTRSELVVLGAGTGGTSATIGRYVRYKRHATSVCVVDPEGSVYLDSWSGSAAAGEGACGSRIEGIGRPRVEPSFVGTVVDAMIRVPDAASVPRCGGPAGCSAGPSVGRRARPCGARWA